MNRDELIRLLARERRRYDRSGGRRGIGHDEARALLRVFDRGGLSAESLPLSNEEVRESSLVTDVIALAALVVVFRAAGFQTTPQGAGQILGAMPRSQRRRVAEGAANRFRQAATSMSASASSGVRTWQQQATSRVRIGILAGSQLGRGALLAAGDLASVARAVLEQSARLARFAGEIATRAAAGRPLSNRQIAARLKMYAGPIRGEYFRGEARRMARRGVVVRFVGTDTARSCQPCVDARTGSPYLPSDPALPLPGLVCDGGGHCKDRLEYEENMGAYVRLGGR